MVDRLIRRDRLGRHGGTRGCLANIDAPPQRRTLPVMSLTTAFNSELVWAANLVEHLTNFEKRRLLERAVVTIREMRNER